jgi:uncharacterized delta-60 repeat protein
MRLDSQGSVDPAFAAKVEFQSPAAGWGDVRLNTIVRQPDGQILVGGTFGQCNGLSRTNLVRLNADGSADLSFNASVTEPSFLSVASVTAIALQPDHKILVAGHFTAVNGVGRNSLARLNPDGSVDPSFQSSEEEPGADYGWLAQQVNDLAVDSDGQILIGGNFRLGSNHELCGIARVNGMRLEISAVLLESNGARTIRFQGTPSATYQLLTSTDLVHWDPAGPADETNAGSFAISLPETPTERYQFYRLRSHWGGER